MGTGVTVTVNDGSNTANVMSTDGHSNVTNIERDKVGDGSVLDIELDGVVNLHVRIGVTDGAAVVGHDVRDSGSLAGGEGVASDGGLLGGSNLLDTEELELGLSFRDSVEDEASLDVVEKTEVLSGLVEGDDI